MIIILDDSLDVVIRKVNRKVVDEELHLQKNDNTAAAFTAPRAAAA